MLIYEVQLHGVKHTHINFFETVKIVMCGNELPKCVEYHRYLSCTYRPKLQFGIRCWLFQNSRVVWGKYLANGCFFYTLKSRKYFGIGMSQLM